jgi:hypothetical protein
VLQRVGIGRDDDPLSTWSLRTLLRAVRLLLTSLMALAAILEFDVVLGAFAAGLALARISGRHTHTLAHSLEQVGFGFFIPMFSSRRAWPSRSPRSSSTRGCCWAWQS